MSPPVVEVVLDSALENPLDYAVPEDCGPLSIGSRVEVPLRGRKAMGTILALKEKSAFANLKPLLQVATKAPPLSSDLLKLAKWISTYYCCPMGKVLKSILPPSLRESKGGHKMQSFVKPMQSQNRLLTACKDLRNTRPSQAKTLEVLLKHPKGLLLTELLEKGNISQSPIKTLESKGLLKTLKMQVDRSPVFAHDFFPTKPKTLTEEQKICFERIAKTLNTFRPHLIFGVTGSGKTEIYLQLIQKALDEKKSVIYLVPEIALTAQTIERFKGRFGDHQIAILHHRLSDGERFDAWHKIQKGQAPIIIGARSALFSPAKNLGLIIVDEEHEGSYKQSDEAPKYHARDVAVVRAKFADCPILLGSATPSIESFRNAEQGKYQLHRLLARADHALLPDVRIIDMRTEFQKAGGYTLFSDQLLKGIKSRLEKGEQTLLFLNRRGYHTSAQCTDCSHTETCPHCDLNLTYHKGESILTCHLCDYRKTPPSSCPSCQKEGKLKYRGVGTEMVEKTLHALLPDVRSLRLDADTTKHKGSHEQIFKRFRSGKADVLIGTQMIAKGLHFPLVTLVGVLGIDGSLNIPDFRASETVFQLLTQVAGRSGRGELKGEVLFQTHLPKHSILQNAASQSYEAFYQEEIEVRKLFQFPPFTHLVKCSFSAADEGRAASEGEAVRSALLKTLPKGVELLPLVPCGYTKIKGNYRYQFLLKVEKIQTILGPLQMQRAQCAKNRAVRFGIDIDPISTYF